MITRPAIALALALAVTTSCAGGGADDDSGRLASTTEPAHTTLPATLPGTVATASTTAPAAGSSTSTTSTTVPPVCTVTVESGDSLRAIVDRIGDATVTLEGLLDENRLLESDVIHPGDDLDVCIGNDIDDVTGASRLPPGPDAVMAQQRKLNELFAPYAIADLLVDGVSGPLTRQALCAARMGFGLRADTTDMSEGSPDEAALLAAESFSIPDGAATWANRWILIDETCQVVFTGEGTDRIVDIYPTSTGQPGFETHNLQAAAAYRYDPAVDNDGWHDSASFPSEVDNPLNGNMYKPLYFNGGQAIHGANVVPPDPRSKGCARLYPWHQDSLIAWLGLAEVTDVTWRAGQIDATVTVQGDYRPP